MEYIIGIILALVGGVFFFKNKADKASVDSKLAKTKGRDQELVLTEQELKEQIKAIDTRLKDLNKERKAERLKTDNLTLAERRERIKKGLK